MTILEFLKLTGEEQKKYLDDRYSKIAELDKEGKLGFLNKNYIDLLAAMDLSVYRGKNLIKGKRGEGPDFISVSRTEKNNTITIYFYEDAWKTVIRSWTVVEYPISLRVSYAPSGDLVVHGRLSKDCTCLVEFGSTRDYIKLRGWV